ncbi:microcin-processing peptidase 2, MEROPS family U62 [Bartonella sp. CDC_skunk]|uniref:metalloprotease TldD n=1 Tax=unclassified Bartonella TaxID=2645622 RepID=UPI00099AF8DE|nr:MULTISPECIES: metalloprotease TldD [unclassified Bartonella]AQX21649.1 microcin-processing peptidase 2, MEROPS family U62 [Bartonella sp. CDC_skunk]AQX26913.1 microcin-processing peptidase 2, MEROPS family U62 [Bartonella sp. Raccoon60]
MKSLIDHFDISSQKVQSLVQEALHKADDGELYLEYTESEVLLFDNGQLKNGSFHQDIGFGLRVVAGETTGYAYSDELSAAALKRASETAKTATYNNHAGPYSAAPEPTSKSLYQSQSPLVSPSFEEKSALLQKIDAYLREKNDKLHQVTVALSGSLQHIEILRADGHLVRDIRPLVRLSISVVAADGNRRENGSYGCGGRQMFDQFICEENWKKAADEALRIALINLEAEEAPAGTFDVVLANGWPGVMLHEAVGHGLEGDFNRKKTSAFSGLLGQQVAAQGVTIVDDGTIPGCRGSLTVDDEGTPSNHNVLIEDGKLVNYMQDRLNARLMGMKPTGNGRRASYAHAPIPRMTNTIMLSGDKTPEEILSSLKNGIYAVSFGGGQVDITSGKFVFECTEAYRVENGKIMAPIRGATLIGNGPDAMKRITMIGNDSKLDNGVGMCGKAGQSVPVGVGQPHLRINNMTIGGTAVS